MKYFCLLILLILFSNSLISQNHAFRFSVAGIVDEPLNIRNFKSKDWRVPSFEFAYQKINSKDDFYHLGIYGIYFQDEVLPAATLKEYGFGMRFMYGFKTLEFSEKLALYLAPMVIVHARFSRFSPFTSIDFPVQQNRTEFFIGGVPSLKFQTKGSAFLHLGFPLVLGSFSSEYTRIQNPAFTIRQQEHSAFNMELFSLARYEIEVGFGVKF